MENLICIFFLIMMYSHGLYCYLEREVLLHVLNDDDEERQPNGEHLLRVCWTKNVGGRHVGSGYLQRQRLYFFIHDSSYVSIFHLNKHPESAQ